MRFDVTIIGGGLAGLTLALQLRAVCPDQRVVILERQADPLPMATHKVGESTVHPGGAYLADVLGLEALLAETALPKYGLRYFFGAQPIARRPEMGRGTRSDRIREYQLDRGDFETRLREMVRGAGVDLRTAVRVRRADDDGVVYEDDAGEHRVDSSWVVDASGRARVLARARGLGRPAGRACSAVWFRVDREIDPDALAGGADAAWLERVAREHPTRADFGRRYSTNHLMGKGRWVWLIPLPGGATSVGIVHEENVCPQAEVLRRRGGAEGWLREHEPELARALPPADEWLDFRVMRKYAHTASQVFGEGWALVGEAGAFSDPFQSPGTDAIGFANSIVTGLIASNGAGGEAAAQRASELYLEWTSCVTEQLQRMYDWFDDEVVTGLAVLWFVGWSMSITMSLLRFYAWDSDRLRADPAPGDSEQRLMSEGAFRAAAVLDELAAWYEARRSKVRLGFDWLDFWSLPFFAEWGRWLFTLEAPDPEGALDRLEGLQSAIAELRRWDEGDAQPAGPVARDLAPFMVRSDR